MINYEFISGTEIDFETSSEWHNLEILFYLIYFSLWL